MPIKILEIPTADCNKYEPRSIKFEDFNLVLFFLTSQYCFNKDSNDTIILKESIKFVKNKSLKIIFVFSNISIEQYLNSRLKENTIKILCPALYNCDLK